MSWPIDAPVDCFIARQVLARRVTALVSQPFLAWQQAPCAKGDIVHTNAFKPNVRMNKDLRVALAESGNLHAACSGSQRDLIELTDGCQQAERARAPLCDVIKASYYPHLA